MLKLTITQIGTPQVKQKRDGSGTYESNYIKAKEYGDKFLNYYVGKSTSQWKPGMVVEVESVAEREYTGRDGSIKKAYDIKLPKFGGGNADVMKALERIENVLAKHGLMITQIGKAVIPQEKDDYPTPESVGLDPKNMANFDNKTDAEVASMESLAEQFKNY